MKENDEIEILVRPYTDSSVIQVLVPSELWGDEIIADAIRSAILITFKNFQHGGIQ